MGSYIKNYQFLRLTNSLYNLIRELANKKPKPSN